VGPDVGEAASSFATPQQVTGASPAGFGGGLLDALANASLARERATPAKGESEETAEICDNGEAVVEETGGAETTVDIAVEAPQAAAPAPPPAPPAPEALEAPEAPVQ
jgi:hypothetical protein